MATRTWGDLRATDGRGDETRRGGRAEAQPLSLARSVCLESKGPSPFSKLGYPRQFRMSGAAGDHGGGGLHPSQYGRL